MSVGDRVLVPCFVVDPGDGTSPVTVRASSTHGNGDVFMVEVQRVIVSPSFSIASGDITIEFDAAVWGS